MDAIGSLFQSGGVSETLGTEVSAADFGTDGALPGQPGGGGFGLDRLFGSSQSIPFVGPVVSVFQAFNDEEDARVKASEIDFNAKAFELQGKADSVNALRQFNDVQAHNVVAGAASGGLGGSRGRVAQDVARDAEVGFTLIRTNAEIKAGALRRKARLLRKQARFGRDVAIGTSLFRFVGSVAGAV